MRDSYAHYVLHPAMLSYLAIGMGETEEYVRLMCIEKMIQPVGPMPSKGQDEESDDAAEDADFDMENGVKQNGRKQNGK